MTIRSTVLTACVALGLLIGAGCAAPLRTTVTPFRPPESYPSSTRIEGLVLAVDPVDTEEHSTRVFGTDLRTAEVLPLHLIARNTGSHEFEINAAQIFGMTAGGEFAGAYTLHQASQRVRESSIGTTAATGLAVGALAGAAAGAAIGGAAGGGEGAATGAAVGGAVGGVGGVAEGTSDTITSRFKRELAAQDFGDRVIAPGNIEHGFVYLTWQPYTSVRIKVFDITTNKVHEVQLPITIRRP
ncbi:hypothetical protein MELA_01044 [Candidatus Methylomirabilis lanthanidiphila]|uniref:Lipoprotein n=1 Tax=Candidatus Methylomirabilis lanthanidiphila TaxID=2211376 RepID=A0A564ZH54_9BACT|nr:hypothetical protein [Candidatus Methylomirabilis lanthanidiphila]VUZ84670.1 hypothetical protein MELA_01044 [Candidatus Methylomirabilis lanthanidiphila]